MHDWLEAKDAWLAGEPVLLPPDRPLPDPIPYTGVLPAKSSWKPPYPDAVATAPVHHKNQPPYPTKERG
ncbi:hypothetical protein AB0M39_25855 [Streptomyces sp. NPDC051907]|uniref:hypothetical protein n=1 Tax=Streptomyces sp. NPDC051907 TaxID=3155284 RepID=UPI003435B029